MSKLAHECDFAQDAFTVCLVFEYILHSFDGDLLSSALLGGEDDFAVAASTEQFLAYIIVSNDPVSELIQAKVSSSTSTTTPILHLLLSFH